MLKFTHPIIQIVCVCLSLSSASIIMMPLLYFGVLTNSPLPEFSLISLSHFPLSYGTSSQIFATRFAHRRKVTL